MVKPQAPSTKSQTSSKLQAPSSKHFGFWNLEFGISRPAGFTLLETIVAMSLIVSALAGPFTLATRGIFSAKLSKNKLIALNLAQEGIEVVRHMRENNVILPANVAAGVDWRGLAPGPCPATCTKLQDGSYQPDVQTAATGSTPPLDTGLALRLDTAAGLYLQASGAEVTPFTRVVSISTPGSDEMQVVSTVSWVEASVSRQVRLQEVLYNWK